jgi:hypothetical protein
LDDLRHRFKESFKWSRASYFLMSAFFLIVILIIVVWWPLVEEYAGYFNPDYPIWIQIDWLLIGIFAVMSILIMSGADLKADLWIFVVGVFGGLVIESWGTQTNLWTYFTLERPPLWIIPAWPIASLAIDRIYRLFKIFTHRLFSPIVWNILYWGVFCAFYSLMLYFVWPTLDKSLTLMALLSCALLILSPGSRREALLVFLAGSALGYFLERWGTTRECWTYYTHQTPPVFAVFAHGLAAVAFWRVNAIFQVIFKKYFSASPLVHLLPNSSGTN